MIDPALAEEEQVVTARTLRQFAGISLVFFGGLAAWHGFVTHRRLLAIVLATIAVVVGGLGLARPERIRALYITVLALTTPVGKVVTYIVLAVLFYGIVTPLGFVLSLFGRDPLRIRRPGPGSHWAPKETSVDVRDYTRQS